MMDKKQAEALANVTTLLAKMGSDPVIVRYSKLKQFAESAGLSLEPDGDQFEVKDSKGRLLFSCDSTEELNDWFKDEYLADVL